MSITSKLVLAVVVAAAVTVPLFGMVVYVSSGKLLRETLMRRREDAARHLMRRIDDTLNDALLDAQAIAESSDLEKWLAQQPPKTTPPSDVIQGMREFEVTTGPWENIKVIDREGVIRLSNDPSEVGERVRRDGERAALNHALNSQTYVSEDVMVSPEFDRPTLIFASPVFTDPPEEVVLGVLVAYYGWPTIVEILDTSSSRVLLLANDGEVLATQSDRRASMLRDRLDRPEVLRAASTRRAAHFTWERGDDAVLATYVPQRGAVSFGARGWGLLTESPLSEVYAPVSRLAWQIAAATLLFFAAFAGVMIWVARGLTRPITRLTQTAQSVIAGDLTARANTRGHDEVSVLGRSFNTMLESLHEEIEGRRTAESVILAEREALADRVAERTAELQRANAQLFRAAKVKDEFLANMSHELRTPLNAILGLSEALGDGMYGPLDGDKRAAIRTIEESGAHLLSLINDVLDVAKIEAGMLEIERDAVSIDALCHASVALLREAAHRKQITLRYGGCNGENCIVAGDFRRLKQVLVNLLSNAVKFTPAGGRVTLDVEQADGVVRMIVSDTGIGIAEEDFDRLFRPFVQIDSGLSRSHEGTGLGLTLVAKLVEMHGGSVGVESTPGGGSRFTVTLPGGTARGSESAGHRDVQAARLDGVRVLVAEDNETNAQIVVRYLRAQGAEVGVARDGEEAVAMAAAGAWSVVLMDIQMPRMDGITAARKIRESRSGARLPIVATTSFAMPHDRRRALEAGMNDYMAKPLRLKQLTRLIAELTAQAQ